MHVGRQVYWGGAIAGRAAAPAAMPAGGCSQEWRACLTPPPHSPNICECLSRCMAPMPNTHAHRAYLHFQPSTYWAPTLPPAHPPPLSSCHPQPPTHPTHPLPSNPLPAATHPLAHPLTTPLIPLCAATQRHLYSEKMRFDQGRFENADAPVSPFGSKFAEGGDTGLGGYRWDRSTAHMSKAGYPFESCACLCTAWMFTAGASQRVFSSCTCVRQQRQAPLNVSLRAGPLRCCTRLSLHLSHAPASASSPPPAAPAVALPCSQTARCQRPATTPTAPHSPWASTSSQRSWDTPRWVGGHWAGGGVITRLTGGRRPKLLYWNECV